MTDRQTKPPGMNATPTAAAGRACFYQTPAMRTDGEPFLPGTLLPNPNNPDNRDTFVILKPNNRYLTPCLNGKPMDDAETDTVVDQEVFKTVEGNPSVLTIDRVRFVDDKGIGRSYLLAIAVPKDQS